MFRALIAFAIKQPALVVTLSLALLVYAALRLPDMQVDVFPELNAPSVVVLTEAGGFAADEVEQIVTFPIESSVNGLPGVRRVRSASAMSLSLVWIEFDWGTDIYRARQLVAERLQAARESLPDSVHTEIAPITSITGEIMLLALSSPDRRLNDLELRAFAEFDLRNALLAVPGIAQVSTIGGSLPEYQVLVDQSRLALHGLSVADLVEAARAAHSTTNAGYLENVEHRELPIRQSASVRSEHDIANTLVAIRNGTPITIGDVAQVALGPAPRRGTAANMGLSAVVLTIQKSPGTNTLSLTREIDRALDQIEPTLPAGVRLERRVFRQSDFIQRSVDNVLTVLRDATIIVALILALFLLNVRATIITLVALPLSLAITLLALESLELTLNVMTLGGLGVAIGALVDDAIIDVENVVRRIRENEALEPSARRSSVEIVLTASNEIRSSMVYATALICLAFLPLMFLTGLEGRFFKPLAITFVIALIASLLVALTVTPALCRLLLAKVSAHGTEPERDGFVVAWLKARYEPTLRFTLRHPRALAGSALALTLGALTLARTFGTSFLPEFNEGSLTVFLATPPGSSLPESDRIARAIEQRLIEIDGVASVTRRTGRAERDEHAEPVSNSELDVTLEADADMATVRETVAGIAAAVPGVTVQIGQPIEHRLSHILSGTPAAIAINVFGEDLAVLRGVAKRIEAELRTVPGARDVTANRELRIQSLPIRYRAEDLAAAGLTPKDAAEQVGTALDGATVATVSQGIRRYDIVVRLAPEERATIDDVAALILRGRTGTQVRLGDVASVGVEETSNLIARENARRKAVVSLNVAANSNLGDLVEEVRRRIEPIVRDAKCTVTFGGQFEAQQSAARTLKLGGLAAACAMLVLIQLATRSFRTALLVMVNLPLAFIGGILSIPLTESEHPVSNLLAAVGIGSASFVPPVISIASLVGFITLFGIAVRNGILLVNHYRTLMEVDGLPLERAIVRGSLERLSPILMTALTAALGLVPLAFASGEPGSELLAPLASVVLGGLLSSTFLNLLIVPTGYALIFGSRRNPASLPSTGE